MKKTNPDEFWMNIAIDEARSAFHENEVPIGAVMVKNNELISKEHNRTNQLNDPLAHAEKLVIETVINSGEKFLNDYTLYVTVEPCLMCAGTIIWSRIGRVVYGCKDPKAGAAGSIYNSLQDQNLNHNPELRSGVLEVECSNLMKDFFKNLR